jgi:hypothetical protein
LLRFDIVDIATKTGPCYCSQGHGGEYARQAARGYSEGWKQNPPLVYECSFDLLLKKLNIFFSIYKLCFFSEGGKGSSRQNAPEYGYSKI